MFLCGKRSFSYHGVAKCQVSGKHFHGSGMRGIDFSHKITPKNIFFTKIFKKIFFSENGPRLLAPFNI
jgi:hypothetical protein